ncbi:hypothetical protein T06_12943 [Trichinella sp. T6]|nr:hypothetical protein T06_12943 [Trichinella sp. T6]
MPPNTVVKVRHFQKTTPNCKRLGEQDVRDKTVVA